MTKIYILTAGSYSDYHIVGAFSTKEKAQEVIESFNRSSGRRGDFNDIEELVIDELSENVSDGRSLCFIRIDRDGNTSDFGFPGHTYSLNEKQGLDTRGNLYVYCFARDKEHAIKIANERRVQMIANNEWPDSPNQK